MEYHLKNGETVTIRVPTPQDAAALVSLMITADSQTRFLARNPGEFERNFTVEQEAAYIQSMRNNPNLQWYVAEYQGKLVGNCSALVPSPGERFRHRGGVAFSLLREYWGLGIGGRMMEHCLAWCRDNGCEQVELDVVAENERALRMYKSFGFEPTGKKPRALKYPDGSYADEICMVKYL